MRITRIYHPAPLLAEQVIKLDQSASKHLLQVLRLIKGAQIKLFDGQGREFVAELLGSEKSQAVLKLLQPVVNHSESPLYIHLGQGISRGDRMDFTLQKAVELGVKEITPLFTEFTTIKLVADRLQQRMLHWQKVIISACEQSGRSYVPRLNSAMKLSDWLKQRTESLRVTLHPEAKQKLSALKQPPEKLVLLVGPEGGLSDQEIQQTINYDFQLTQVGPRILRTETAAMTAMAILQSRWGDL